MEGTTSHDSRQIIEGVLFNAECRVIRGLITQQWYKLQQLTPEVAEMFKGSFEVTSAIDGKSVLSIQGSELLPFCNITYNEFERELDAKILFYHDMIDKLGGGRRFGGKIWAACLSHFVKQLDQNERNILLIFYSNRRWKEAVLTRTSTIMRNRGDLLKLYEHVELALSAVITNDRIRQIKRQMRHS